MTRSPKRSHSRSTPHRSSDLKIRRGGGRKRQAAAQPVPFIRFIRHPTYYRHRTQMQPCVRNGISPSDTQVMREHGRMTVHAGHPEHAADEKMREPKGTLRYRNPSALSTCSPVPVGDYREEDVVRNASKTCRIVGKVSFRCESTSSSRHQQTRSIPSSVCGRGMHGSGTWCS